MSNQRKRSNQQKRQQRFNELSINLGFYTNYQFRGQFACPICLRLFNSIDELSDAHIVPQAMGGSLVTITCKKCNNEVGSTIESYEIERAKFNRTFSGDGKNSWSVSLYPLHSNKESGKVIANMRLIEDGQKQTYEFKIIPRQYSPAALKEIRKSLMNPGGGFNVNLRAKAGWRRARLTYLHSAFLFLFDQFGYEWALNPCTTLIREQIQKPQEDLISFNTIELFKFSGDLTKPSVNLIVQPKESKGFLVIFPQLAHWELPVAVWMPLFDSPYQLPEEVSNLRIEPLPRLNSHLSTLDSVWLGHKFAQAISLLAI